MSPAFRPRSDVADTQAAARERRTIGAKSREEIAEEQARVCVRDRDARADRPSGARSVTSAAPVARGAATGSSCCRRRPRHRCAAARGARAGPAGAAAPAGFAGPPPRPVLPGASPVSRHRFGRRTPATPSAAGSAARRAAAAGDAGGAPPGAVAGGCPAGVWRRRRAAGEHEPDE